MSHSTFQQILPASPHGTAPLHTFMLTQQPQCFVITHQSRDRIAQAVPVTWQPHQTPGCFALIHDSSAEQGFVHWANQTQHNGAATYSYGTSMSDSDRQLSVTTYPDTFLNPNSPEFEVKRREPRGNTDSKVESAKTNCKSRTGSANDKRQELVSELSKLNIRSNSSDSGFSVSPQWSTDDEREELSALPERVDGVRQWAGVVWNINDDERYWRVFRSRPPSASLCSSIVTQIEYYMSDEYLSKDKYLLRQIRCKKDGYVSIKLMTSFKKMKKLARDFPILRSAIIRKSKHLVVSKEGLRIRRKKALPEELKKPRLITTVLAIRLPPAYSTIEKIMNLYGMFGEVTSVQKLESNGTIPDNLRNYATQVPDIGKALCAVVIYKSSKHASQAVHLLKYVTGQSRHSPANEKTGKEVELSDEDRQILNEITESMPDLEGMRLALLGPRLKRTLYKQDSRTRPARDTDADAFFKESQKLSTKLTQKDVAD